MSVLWTGDTPQPQPAPYVFTDLCGVTYEYRQQSAEEASDWSDDDE